MNRPKALVYLAATLAMVSAVPMAQSAAEPETVGTAVNVVIHTSFEQTPDADQCVGAGALAAVRRGASVVEKNDPATDVQLWLSRRSVLGPDRSMRIPGQAGRAHAYGLRRSVAAR